MGWRSYFVNWFLKLKREVTCEEMERKKQRVLDLRCHGLENCDEFNELVSPGNFQILRGLLLQSNQLTEFSKSLARSLPNLFYLTLDYNCLTDLPYEIRHMRRLTILNVSHNNFGSGLHYFYVICQLKSLRILWANATGLQEIPKEVGELKKLRTLGLRGNQIKLLPDELFSLPYLRWLTLTSNEISILPDDVAKLRYLVHLNLNYNKLTQLPTTINQLKELQYLYLKHNKIKITSEVITLISSIPTLRSCWVTGNIRHSTTHHNQNNIEVVMISHDPSTTRQSVQSPSSPEVDSPSEEGSSSTGTYESTEDTKEDNDVLSQETPLPVSASSKDDLETVFRRGSQSLDESLDMRENHNYDLPIEALDQRRIEEHSKNNNDNNADNIQTQDIMPETSCQLCRIQEWLLNQNVLGNGNTTLSTPISHSQEESENMESTRLDSGISPCSLDSQNKKLSSKILEPVMRKTNAFVDESIEMATNTLQPVLSTTGSLTFFSNTPNEQNLQETPSITSTFHRRGGFSTISVRATPSVLLPLRGPNENQEVEEVPSQTNHSVVNPEFRDEANGEIRTSYAPDPEILRLESTMSTMLRIEHDDTESAYDPTDWEYSSPSSAIDDQDILARFNEFSDLADDEENNLGDVVQDEDLKYVLPVALLQ